MQGVCAVRFADHLPSARPVNDPGNRFNDAVVSARQILAFLMLPESATWVCGAAPWASGGVTQLRCFRGRAARTCKKHFVRSSKCGWKWQEEQDQRAIQSRDVNNGSYLVTWVTSCSSRQPLPNLWTSLVRAEPQQSPRAPAASADHHLRTFSPPRKVPGHWPCLPQAGARREASIAASSRREFYL